MTHTLPNIDAGGRRRNLLFLVLAGFFLGNALLAELIGGKLFQVPTPWRSLISEDSEFATWRNFTLSCGIILWPGVFIISDIVNEYFGRAGVKRLSFLAAAVISYGFLGLWLTNMVPAFVPSPLQVDDASFQRVFMQSSWIIVGSITAFLVAQLVDVTVFWIIRRRTGHRYLWLRATGSTVVSQLIDTLVVQFIGLHLPYLVTGNGMTFVDFINSASSGYLFKIGVAIAITPLLYLVHNIIDAYLGDEAQVMIETVAHKEHAADVDVGVPSSS
jgi:queuosine precursor transporter